MGKNDFKNETSKEKLKIVFAAIILGIIFLFIIGDCSGNSAPKASTRGLIIGH